MFGLIHTRRRHGFPFVPDIPGAAVAPPFRGLPHWAEESCPPDCRACVEACPSGAVTAGEENAIDLGRCVFCGDCARACPAGILSFTTCHFLAVDRPEKLRVGRGVAAEGFEAGAFAMDSPWTMFRRSFKLRQVSAAGCNGCEMELNACGNVNFDMGRFGFEFTASPRHADAVVVSGPISANMAAALDDTLAAVPEPKLVILVGACAISGGVFASSPALRRDFLQRHPAAMYVPGCPPHPLTFINGLLRLVGRVPR